MFPLRLLAVSSVLALVIGCSPPGMDSVDRASTKHARAALSDSHSYRLPASKTTRAATGVKTWRLLTQGPKTTVIEGVDAKGKVKLATSFRISNDKLSVVGYRVGPKNESDDVARANWRKLMTAFSSDAKSGKPVAESNGLGASHHRGNVKQTCWGIWCSQYIDNPTGGSNEQTCGGIYCKSFIRSPEGSSDSQKCTAFWCSSTIEKTPAATPPEPAKAFDQMSDLATESNPDSSPESTPDADEPSAESTPDETTPDDEPSEGASTDDSTFDPAEDPSDEGDVSAEEQDDSLDEGAGDAFGGDDFGGDDFGGDDFGSDDSGGSGDDFESSGSDSDSGDFDSGGDDFSGGDDGGGEEFALHNVCQHLSCSKSTQVCICTRY